MNLKKAARARARDAVAAAAATAAAAAPKNPSMKYTIWKFIFQGKVIKTHQSPKKNAANIGNLSQNAESSNIPNKLHSKRLLAKAPVRRAPQTRKARGMRKLPTKPILVPRPVRGSAKHPDKKIAPQKRGKLGRVSNKEAILHPDLSVREVQKNGQGNAPGTFVTAGLGKNFPPSRIVGASRNNNYEKPSGMNDLGTAYMWQDPCLQVLSPVSGVEDIDEQVEKTQEVCELESMSSLAEESQHAKVLIDWATFDFNAALVYQGNNSIVSSYETQSETRSETHYEGMHLEIDILSFANATVDSYYIFPNYDAADDMLVSLWE